MSYSLSPELFEALQLEVANHVFPFGFHEALHLLVVVYSRIDYLAELDSISPDNDEGQAALSVSAHLRLFVESNFDLSHLLESGLL